MLCITTLGEGSVTFTPVYEVPINNDVCVSFYGMFEKKKQIELNVTEEDGDHARVRILIFFVFSHWPWKRGRGPRFVNPVSYCKVHVLRMNLSSLYLYPGCSAEPSPPLTHASTQRKLGGLKMRYFRGKGL